MSWWAVVLLVLAGILLFPFVLFLLLAPVRLKVRARLEEGKFSGAAFAGPVRVVAFGGEKTPKKPKKKKEKKEKKEKPPKPKEEKPKEKAPKKKKKGLPYGMGLEEIGEWLSFVGRVFSRLGRRIRADELTLYYLVAGDDPAEVGQQHGYICAVTQAILPRLEDIFWIKKGDIRTGVSFLEEKPWVFLNAQLSLSIWQLEVIAAGAVKTFLKTYLSARPNRRAAKANEKGDQNNGKQAA